MSGTRVIRHESDLGTWETVLREPPAHLRPFVDNYGAWTEHSLAFSSRRELPTGIVPMHISFEAPYDIGAPSDPGRTPEPFPDFIAGQHDTYAISNGSGRHGGIQVGFTAFGARLFLELPMSEVTNRVLRMEEVLGSEGRILAERLRDAPTWDDCFDILDATITRRIARASGLTRGIPWAFEQLWGPARSRPVSELAAELGVTHRALIASFHDNVGLAPRTVARIGRFTRALQSLGETSCPSWVDVALDAGYYDQSHLNRDFRDFTGYSPTEFRRRQVPDNGGLVDA